MKTYSQRGFTLVELLVVVAIVGILSALLLTSLRSAMHNGKRTQCASQLHQLHIAFTLYANDNSSNLPNINNDVPDGPQGIAAYLNNYVENVNPAIYQCTSPSSSSPIDSYYYMNDAFETFKPAGLDKFSQIKGDPVSKIEILGCRFNFKNGVNTGFMPHAKGVNTLFGDGRVVYDRKS